MKKITHFKFLYVISGGYILLLIYASLMPFDFIFDLERSSKRLSFWGYWPINPNARISGSDILSNLILYIPLGWVIAVRGMFVRVNALVPLLTAGLTCSLISAGVEGLQMYTISRVASGSDWLLNTISGFLGAFAGVGFGKELWLHGIKWVKLAWEEKPVIIAALIFSVILLADAFSPYMPTLLLKQLGHNMKSSNFNPAQGFFLHPWHWWVFRVGSAYFLLTLLFSYGVERRPVFVKLLTSCFLSAGFCLFLEISKIFIVSRSFNIANVFAGWGGCCAAVIFGVFIKKMSHRKSIELGICYIFLYIFYLGWFPFDFNLSNEGLIRIPSLIKFLPLYEYAMGASLNHARLFFQSIFLPAVLVYLLRIRFSWFDKPVSSKCYAALFCGGLGFLQELGQLFLLSRYPSATDIYCFAIGGCFGAWVKRHPNHTCKP